MRGRSGVTLLELLVALAVAATTLLLAGAALGSAMEARRVLVDGRASLDERENATRVLMHSLRSADVGSPGASAFEGDSMSLRFSAWQPVPGGWAELRRVAVGVEAGRLVARAPDLVVVPSDDVADASFAYLASFDRVAGWVRTWSSPISAPAAVRIVVRHGRSSADDTLLLFVGAAR